MKHLGFAALSIVCLASARLPAQEYVWLEGEKPASINVKPLIAGWGNKQFLSGEQWLQVSIDAGKVEKEMPEEGVLIQYPFRLKKEGTYEVWNRIHARGVGAERGESASALIPRQRRHGIS